MIAVVLVREPPDRVCDVRSSKSTTVDTKSQLPPFQTEPVDSTHFRIGSPPSSLGSVKNLCAKASLAVILLIGSYSNKSVKRLYPAVERDRSWNQWARVGGRRSCREAVGHSGIWTMSGQRSSVANQQHNWA